MPGYLPGATYYETFIADIPEESAQLLPVRNCSEKILRNIYIYRRQ